MFVRQIRRLLQFVVPFLCQTSARCESARIICRTRVSATNSVGLRDAGALGTLIRLFEFEQRIRA